MADTFHLRTDNRKIMFYGSRNKWNTTYNILKTIALFKASSPAILLGGGNETKICIICVLENY